jgi:hypothetical protein
MNVNVSNYQFDAKKHKNQQQISRYIIVTGVLQHEELACNGDGLVKLVQECVACNTIFQFTCNLL